MGNFRGGSEFIGQASPTGAYPSQRKTVIAIDQAHGDLTVIGQAVSLNGTRWRCQCVCKAVVVVRASELTRKEKPRRNCGAKCSGTKQEVERG